jgi:hypothetical protein
MRSAEAGDGSSAPVRQRDGCDFDTPTTWATPPFPKTAVARTTSSRNLNSSRAEGPDRNAPTVRPADRVLDRRLAPVVVLAERSPAAVVIVGFGVARRAMDLSVAPNRSVGQPERGASASWSDVVHI